LTFEDLGIYIYIHRNIKSMALSKFGIPTQLHPAREGRRLQRSPDAVRSKNALAVDAGAMWSQQKTKNT
jgi:hypothetical protein